MSSFLPAVPLRYHLIAIGGSIMHSLALDLQAAGHTVTGSDDAIYDPAHSRLEQVGLLPERLGWFPDKINPQLDVVVLGMHAKANNPELLRAKELGLRVMSFPELVFDSAKQKQRIVIAGSHGKTTITSMVLHVAQKAGIQFDYLVGGQIPGFERPVRLGTSAPVLIVEGDEYATSPLDPRPKFLTYQPHIVLLSGIAWDHINVFPTEADYFRAFENLIHTLPKAGALVYNKQDPQVRRLAKMLKPEYHYAHPYGKPIYRTRAGQVQLKHGGKYFPVSVFGDHNLSNLAGAMEVCKLLAIPPEEFLIHVADFRGVGLRMQTELATDQLTIIRDFAHAPSKVKATVAALGRKLGLGRRFKVPQLKPSPNLIAVLELHTYSSLNKAFLPQYRDSLKLAKHSIVYVDPAALAIKNMPPISQAELQEAFHARDLQLVSSGAELEQAILARMGRKNDVVLLMSSGGLGGFDWRRLVG